MSEPSLSHESRLEASRDGAHRNGPPSLSERVQSLRLPDRQAAPPTWRTLLPWGLCLVLAAAAGYLALRDQSAEPDRDGPAGAVERSPGEERGSVHAGAPAAPPAGEVALRNKGNITPIHLIQVSPKIGGMVLRLYIKEGDNVKKDQVLAELEKIEYESDYAHAVAQARSARRRWTELKDYRETEIAQTKAEMDEAEAQREQLFLDYKRSQGLRGTGLSARDFEQAESAYRAMQRRVDRLRLAFELMKKGPRDERIAAAKADWDLAQADVVKAKWRLDNCVVRAPITGTILTKKAEEGNMVNPAAFTISAFICEMADLAELEVDVAVPERDIGQVVPPRRDPASKRWRCQKCRIVPEAYGDRSYTGYVSRIMPTADRGHASVPVRVKIDIPRAEAGQYLRPDMGAVVYFLNSTVETKD